MMDRQPKVDLKAVGCFPEDIEDILIWDDGNTYTVESDSFFQGPLFSIPEGDENVPVILTFERPDVRQSVEIQAGLSAYQLIKTLDKLVAGIDRGTDPEPGDILDPHRGDVMWFDRISKSPIFADVIDFITDEMPDWLVDHILDRPPQCYEITFGYDT